MDLNCCELTLARILLLVLIKYQIHNLTTCKLYRQNVLNGCENKCEKNVKKECTIWKKIYVANWKEKFPVGLLMQLHHKNFVLRYVNLHRYCSVFYCKLYINWICSKVWERNIKAFMYSLFNKVYDIRRKAWYIFS